MAELKTTKINYTKIVYIYTHIYIYIYICVCVCVCKQNIFSTKYHLLLLCFTLTTIQRPHTTTLASLICSLKRPGIFRYPCLSSPATRFIYFYFYWQFYQYCYVFLPTPSYIFYVIIPPHPPPAHLTAQSLIGIKFVGDSMSDWFRCVQAFNSSRVLLFAPEPKARRTSIATCVLNLLQYIYVISAFANITTLSIYLSISLLSTCLCRIHYTSLFVFSC